MDRFTSGKIRYLAHQAYVDGSIEHGRLEGIGETKSDGRKDGTGERAGTGETRIAVRIPIMGCSQGLGRTDVGTGCRGESGSGRLGCPCDHW